MLVKVAQEKGYNRDSHPVSRDAMGVVVEQTAWVWLRGCL